jgi:uncharacterized protein (TIGR03083 family)
MTDLATITGALDQSYAAIEAVCAGLDDTGWQAQSLCPDWTVRGVISHLASVEHVLAGWLPDSAEVPPPFGRAATFVTQSAGLPDGRYAALVADVLAGRRADLAALSQGDLERPSWTPVGPATYGRFLGIRVFDFWVHERDITTPLGLPTDDTGRRAEIALAEVEGALGYIVGKKVGLPDGRSIVFHLTGPLPRDLSVVVAGRAAVVDHVEHPDVELTTDSVTFIQLASGRIDPQGAIDSGAVRWTGDSELGERAARNLRFTM